MNQINILKKIESQYPVGKIKFEDTCIWPLFRIYIADLITSKNDQDYKSKSQITNPLKAIKIRSIFKVNWYKVLIQKYDLIVFSKTSLLSEICNKTQDRVVGGYQKKYKCLNIYKHDEDKKSKSLSSVLPEEILYIFQIILFPFIGKKFEGNEVLKRIIKEYDISLNYKFIFKRFKSQILLSKLLFNSIKFDKVIMVYHPSYFGYLYYMNKNKIENIEVQHGVVNKYHPAYNQNRVFSNESDKLIFPSKFHVFSVYFKKVFEKFNWIEANNIDINPYFYLSESKKCIKLKDDKKLISFAGQNAYDKKILQFCNHSLSTIQNLDLKPHYLFRKVEGENRLDSQITFSSGNLYDVLSKSAVHVVYTSTTIFESLSFGIPVIVLGIDDLPLLYYKDLIDGKFVRLVSNQQEFKKAIIAMASLSFKEVKEYSKSYM